MGVDVDSGACKRKGRLGSHDAHHLHPQNQLNTFMKASPCSATLAGSCPSWRPKAPVGALDVAVELPAISKAALKRISAQVRSWRLHQRTHPSEADLARWINPIVRGWMNYYGAFYKSALYPLLERINAYLMRWIRKKYKRLRGRKKAQDAWNQAIKRRSLFFAHWVWTTYPPRVW